MKRLFLFATTSLMVCSCATDGVENNIPSAESEGGEKVSITVAAPDSTPESRVAFSKDADGINTLWAEGDALSAWSAADNTLSQFTMKEGSLSADCTSAKFEGSVPAGDYRLIHPYVEGATANKINLSSQSVDMSGDGLDAMSKSTYMISSVVEGDNIVMKHIGSMIKVVMRFDNLPAFSGIKISRVALSGVPTTATIDLAKEATDADFVSAGSNGTITAAVENSPVVAAFDSANAAATSYVVMLNSVPFTLAAEQTIEVLVTLTTADGDTFNKLLSATNGSSAVEFARAEYNTIYAKADLSQEMSLNWEQSYESKEGAYVQFSSPAVSPDGENIYVTSSGYNLACYNTAGEQQWINKMGTNPSATNNSGTLKGPTPTPSVDADGTVYAAAGFKEKTTVGGQSVIVSYGADGSEKWTTELTGNASLRYFAPVITPEYIMFSDRGTTKNFHVLGKSNGTQVYEGHCNAGSYGGVIALQNGIAIAATGGSHGSRVFFESAKYPEIEEDEMYKGLKLSQTAGSLFYASSSTSSDRAHNYTSISPAALASGNLIKGSQDNCEYPGGSAMAADASQKVYIVNSSQGYYGTQTGAGNAVVYCYDTNKSVFGEYPDPEWVCVVKGGADQTGVGVVVAADGTVYTTSHLKDAWKSFVTAITPDGQKKWEYQVEGEVKSSVAVDAEGCIYYNDLTAGKLVKLSADGEWISEILLGEDIYSSPTIADDGTIYINGMKGGKPTLFSVTCPTTTTYADSWSQLGGSPQKTFYKY